MRLEVYTFVVFPKLRQPEYVAQESRAIRDVRERSRPSSSLVPTVFASRAEGGHFCRRRTPTRQTNRGVYVCRRQNAPLAAREKPAILNHSSRESPQNYVPRPVNGTACGLPPPSSLMDTSPVRFPLLSGWNVTLMKQLPPDTT